MDVSQLDEESIYHVARGIRAPAARSAYLRQACGGDAAFLDRLEAWLRASEEASFLEAPACEATVDLPDEAGGPGTSIGPYRVLEAIGEGGWARSTWPSRRLPSAAGWP